jgi:hypothetical protein
VGGAAEPDSGKVANFDPNPPTYKTFLNRFTPAIAAKWARVNETPHRQGGWRLRYYSNPVFVPGLPVASSTLTILPPIFMMRCCSQNQLS